MAVSQTQGTTGPPVLWSVTEVLILLAAFIFAVVAGPTANLVGFLVGSVLGTANLAMFLAADNKRRATRRYGDWSISPRRVIPWITLASWAIGAWNVFFWALHLTRP